MLSNKTRKDFIAQDILKAKPKKVSFYRLNMKKGSDNFRSSSIQGIIERILAENIRVVVFEPGLNECTYLGAEVISDLDIFKVKCDVIVANRRSECLNDVAFKCYSRDIYGNN